MNVDGAFILAEICRNQEDLIASVCWQQHADISQIYIITNLGTCFVTRITLSHAFKKYIKMSKWFVTLSVSAQNVLALWTLVPRARAALFENMPFVRVLETITFCSLFSYPFHDFNHHSNQQRLLLEKYNTCVTVCVFTHKLDAIYLTLL